MGACQVLVALGAKVIAGVAITNTAQFQIITPPIIGTRWDMVWTYFEVEARMSFCPIPPLQVSVSGRHLTEMAKHFGTPSISLWRRVLLMSTGTDRLVSTVQLEQSAQDIYIYVHAMPMSTGPDRLAKHVQ